MNLAESIASIADAATSDLIALGKAIYDVLEQRANAQSLQAAAVQATEVAADVAEAEKFGP